MTELQFIKSKFNTPEDARNASKIHNGMAPIIFDETHQAIFAGGVQYSGVEKQTVEKQSIVEIHTETHTETERTTIYKDGQRFTTTRKTRTSPTGRINPPNHLPGNRFAKPKPHRVWCVC